MHGAERLLAGWSAVADTDPQLGCCCCCSATSRAHAALLIVRLKLVGAAGGGVDLAALVAAPLLLRLLVPEVLAPHLHAGAAGQAGPHVGALSAQLQTGTSHGLHVAW